MACSAPSIRHPQSPPNFPKYVSVKNHETVSLGKYGSFQSNLIIGRPYNVTYEVIGKQEGQSHSGLRIVPASELHADVIAEENAAANPASDDTNVIGGDGVEFTLMGENGEVIMRSNRETIDDSARQTLTMEEIEALKRDGSNAGQDLIAKLMLSHTAIDEKTKFSLAKYKLTKTRKYLKRFTVLPLDVAMLAHYLIEEKDNTKIMELSQEMIALAGCWANVHFARGPDNTDELGQSSGGRWLLVDETGGLLVAAMAERMGILYPDLDSDEEQAEEENEELPEPGNTDSTAETNPPLDSAELPTENTESTAESNPLSNSTELPTEDSNEEANAALPTPKYQYKPREIPFLTSNTLTLIHNNSQPNLSLLKYLNYDPNSPSPSHPLSRHLHTLSWLQLLSPNSDPAYSQPPPTCTPSEIAAMKSGKRGTYLRKLRRHLRTKATVDSTREGGFDGLIITSNISPVSILQHLIHLLKGGAPVVIYSPVIEPLVELADLYSTSRKTAFITSPPVEPIPNPTDTDLPKTTATSDFPLNPTLLLSVGIQTSKIRKWQVLPGRTHPLMTARGGGEGYLFTGIKVVPAEGKVEARGKFVRRRVGELNEKRNGGDSGVDGDKGEGSGGIKRVKIERDI